jgi:transposase
MPKFLYARPAVDPDEERKIRKLAGARHAPGDWIRRAKMIVLSWQGLHTTAIAAQLGCHAQTVRERLARFNAEGLDGLGDRPISGRPRRLTEAERSAVIALARSTPPGRPVRQPDGSLEPDALDATTKPAYWTLDALATVARRQGIVVARSQIRRILRAEGVPWRGIRSWATSTDPQFGPKGRRSSSSTPSRPRAPR